MSNTPASRAVGACLGFAFIAVSFAACHPNGGGGGQSSSGAPYVWACTPAQFPNSASTTRADLYVFKAGAATANVSVNILDKDGNNLAGVTIPGTNPAQNYPGQTGNATTPLPPAHTMNVTWTLPAIFQSDANASASVRVTSDQPVAVGSDFEFSGFHTLPCSYVPR
ncbi:MAG: hypothetical protein ABR563_00145 [Pyrinomonadaceae bacterium]